MIIGMDERELTKLSFSLIYRVRRRFEEADAANTLDWRLLEVIEKDVIEIVEGRRA
jgi:hypothetical protein